MDRILKKTKHIHLELIVKKGQPITQEFKKQRLPRKRKKETKKRILFLENTFNIKNYDNKRRKN